MLFQKEARSKPAVPEQGTTLSTGHQPPELWPVSEPQTSERLPLRDRERRAHGYQDSLGGRVRAVSRASTWTWRSDPTVVNETKPVGAECAVERCRPCFLYASVTQAWCLTGCALPGSWGVGQRSQPFPHKRLL